MPSYFNLSKCKIRHHNKETSFQPSLTVILNGIEQAAIFCCAVSSMRFHLIYIFLHQLTDSPHGVDWEPLVGVDSNTEEARVGVDQSLNIALLQIEEDRRIIEIGQAGHVLTAVILGRIDLNVGNFKNVLLASKM